MAETGAKVTRVYSGFRGVDFRSEECDLTRSPDALNVWRNYKKTSGIETRPALKHIDRTSQSVTDMIWFGDTLYYYTTKGSYHKVVFNADGSYDHTGDDLYYAGDHGCFFVFDGSLYLLGSKEYVKLAGNGESETYVPTTSDSALPNGTGRKTKQDVNMLTPYRINTFQGDYYNPKDPDAPSDGSYSSELHLDAEKIDSDFKPEITINDITFKVGDEVPEELREYFNHVEVDYERGILEFAFTGTDYSSGRIPAPKTRGTDNISVKFSKTVKDADGKDVNREKILGCTIVEEFDNRIFLSGNPEHPNLVFHSSLNNPMYFSDTDVYEDGKDDGYIRAMVSGNNALWVFRDTDKGRGVYYHTASFDETYGKVYPVVHSNVPTGCVGGAINFLDDIVFFSQNGMESISQNITAEQFATHKSSLVDRLMVGNPKYKEMVFAEWEDYLLVCMGTDVFLADSRAIMANEGHYEYEWYHWNLGKYKINCAAVKDGVLYIGTDGDDAEDAGEGHIYSIDVNSHKDLHADGEAAIESYWTTPKDKFYAPNKVKNTNKKGCVIECTGDLTISSKVDDGNGFDEGDTFTGVNDHIVTKIKRKKFKDMQLKFTSTTDFTLESATLEAFVGSYIK